MNENGIVYRKKVFLLHNKEFNVSLSVCESGGIFILAVDSEGQQFKLHPSRKELLSESITQNIEGYEKLLNSLKLEQNPLSSRLELVSGLRGLKNVHPLRTAMEVEDYLATVSTGDEKLSEVLARGLTELCRVKPIGINGAQWLGRWLLQNNSSQPKVDILKN